MRDGIISEQMKSRLIKAGLPATYEELVAMAADTGIPADILFNEEGWQQLPTFLKKSNLLSDATEVAIWETAQNRTVNDALKMLADVAYGRVASLTLTIKDTAGNPIPDVTVRLDSAPTVGQDPTTGTDGKIKLDTSGGSHTLYLVYPLGYSVENAQQTVQVTGNTAVTVSSVSRKAESTVFNLTEAKAFYIARFLSPVQFDIRGGGGSGAVIGAAFSSVMNSSDLKKYASGAAGGYVTITDAIDVSGKLVRVIPGAGGNPATINGEPSSGSYKTTNGNDGGTTIVFVENQELTAEGGKGGIPNSAAHNTNGGAYGGAGVPSTSFSPTNNGEDGRYLFDDSSCGRKGAGGGGAYVKYDKSSSYDSSEYEGAGGKGGGSKGIASANKQGTPIDATDASGSGAVVSYMSSDTLSSGKGGPGFVAFRKAV